MTPTFHIDDNDNEWVRLSELPQEDRWGFKEWKRGKEYIVIYSTGDGDEVTSRGDYERWVKDGGD